MKRHGRKKELGTGWTWSGGGSQALPWAANMPPLGHNSSKSRLWEDGEFVEPSRGRHRQLWSLGEKAGGKGGPRSQEP